MCFNRYEGSIAFRGSKWVLQGENMGIQYGSLSSIKSSTCQIMSDLAKRDQREFNQDIDFTE